jgi:hypothetical protein
LNFLYTTFLNTFTFLSKEKTTALLELLFFSHSIRFSSPSFFSLCSFSLFDTLKLLLAPFLIHTSSGFNSRHSTGVKSSFFHSNFGLLDSFRLPIFDQTQSLRDGCSETQRNFEEKLFREENIIIREKRNHS